MGKSSTNAARRLLPSRPRNGLSAGRRSVGSNAIQTMGSDRVALMMGTRIENLCKKGFGADRL